MPAGVALVSLLLQAAPRADFLHVSDVHVDARPSGTPAPDRVRGEETFEWIAREFAALDAPARPEFVLATGDLTEFGAPGETWRDLERLFARLPIPWHPLPGNHDQTWNPIDAPYFARLDALETRLLAQRSYLVKRDGWALLALNSATLFEPRPSFEPDDLREVQGLLGVHAWARPLVVALHHPPDSAEFAQPHALRTLFSALDGFDVELVLYGHGHAVKHHRVFGVDCVQGGSTFASKGRDERGYGRVRIADGRIAYDYRWLDAQRAERRLVDRALVPAPEARAGLDLSVERADRDAPAVLAAEWTPPQPRLGPDRVPWRVLVDGVEVPGLRWSAAPCEDCDRFEVPLATLGLGEGRRLVTLEIALADGRARQRSIEVDPRAVPHPVRGIGGHPRSDPAPLWPHWFHADAATAWSIEHLVRDTLPGRPLREGDRVYVGDSAGRVRAIEIGSGGERESTRVLWTSAPVGMAIESAPARFGDLLVVGAWDGNVHAFDAATGERRWSSPGPKSSEGGAARYYAPADCAPVVLRDRAYVCDRGHQLGWYAPDGSLTRLAHANVAAIGASADGEHLFLRGTDGVLQRVDRDGAPVWRAEVPLGRVAVPPVEHDGVVHVVSDQGLWSQVDARTGRILKTISASATAYVFEPPVVEADGTIRVRSSSGSSYVAPAFAAPR